MYIYMYKYTYTYIDTYKQPIKKDAMSLKENKNEYIEKVWRERNEKENDVIIILKNERNF